jgi:hypothetical protein
LEYSYFHGKYSLNIHRALPRCKKIQKLSFSLLTRKKGRPITRFIDGGNVAGDRALRSKFRKTGRLGLDRKVR